MAQTEPTHGCDYYRNYNENDSTHILVSSETSSVVVNYDHSSLNFSAPEGKVFKEWNSARNGSGNSYSVGASSLPSSLYAVWEDAPITYYVTETELTSVANAIRTKGDTSAALTWPDGFVDAIDTIETGGSETLYIFSFAGYSHDSASVGGNTIPSKIAYSNSALVAGAEVTFRTYNHYVLRSITGVTSGNSISFTTVSNGVYTFTMPNESVSCDLYYDD